MYAAGPNGSGLQPKKPPSNQPQVKEGQEAFGVALPRLEKKRVFRALLKPQPSGEMLNGCVPIYNTCTRRESTYQGSSASRLHSHEPLAPGEGSREISSPPPSGPKFSPFHSAGRANPGPFRAFRPAGIPGGTRLPLCKPGAGENLCHRPGRRKPARAKGSPCPPGLTGRRRPRGRPSPKGPPKVHRGSPGQSGPPAGKPQKLARALQTRVGRFPHG